MCRALFWFPIDPPLNVVVLLKPFGHVKKISKWRAKTKWQTKILKNLVTTWMNYRSIFEQLIKHTSKYSFGKREKEKFAADATRALKLF